MSDEQITETTEQAPETEAPAETTETTEVAEESAEQKPEMSPEDYQAALEKVRKEAAGYRTRLRDTEKRLEGLKTPEDVQAAIEEVRQQNAEHEHSLLAENAALKFSLSPTLAARLQGSTRDELEADAKALSEEFGAPTSTGNARGGLAPQSQHEDVSAEEIVRRYGKRSRG